MDQSQSRLPIKDLVAQGPEVARRAVQAVFADPDQVPALGVVGEERDLGSLKICFT